MTDDGRSVMRIRTYDSGGHARSATSTIRVLVVAVLTVVVSACGSSSTSPTTTTATGTAFLRQTGTGDRSLAPVTLPAKWTVAWRFDCSNRSVAGPFTLTASTRGGAPVTVTTQSGLGGGGYKPSTIPGRTTFAVTTTCGWSIIVGSTRLTTPAAPTGSSASA